MPSESNPNREQKSIEDLIEGYGSSYEAGRSLVDELVAHANVEVILPLYHGSIDHPRVEYLVVVTRDVAVYARDSEGWTELSRFTPTNPPRRFGDLYNGDLLFTRSDTASAKLIERTLHKTDYARAKSGIDISLDRGSEENLETLVRSLIRERLDTCDCSRQAHIRFPDDHVFQVDICLSCLGIETIVYDGTTLPTEEVYDANWILESTAGHRDRIVEIGDQDSYLIEVAGIDEVRSTNLPARSTPTTRRSGFSRGQAALFTLSYEAFLDNWMSGFECYNPAAFAGSLYVVDDRVVGYTLWTPALESWLPWPLLQQVYVRPEERRNRYGTQLVTGWYDQCIGRARYYALDPNDRGRALLKAIGHLDSALPSDRETDAGEDPTVKNDIRVPAVEAYVLTTQPSESFDSIGYGQHLIALHEQYQSYRSDRRPIA